MKNILHQKWRTVFMTMEELASFPDFNPDSFQVCFKKFYKGRWLVVWPRTVSYELIPKVVCILKPDNTASI